MITPVEFRRWLHRHAELSFHETEAQRFILETLAAAGIECRPIAKTGVLAKIGSGAGPAIVLHTDIDGLPIQEEVDVEWKSQNPGAMHACGHDLHSGVLYGVLLNLKNNPDLKGTVYGLFQPAEEKSPGGAVDVLKEWGEEKAVFLTLHVAPELNVGQLGFRGGKYMASSDEMHLTVKGRGGHAALRTTIVDPVLAAAKLTLDLVAMNREDRVVSIGKIDSAGASNIIPDTVTLSGTMRLFDEAEREKSKQEIHRLAAENDARYGTQTDVHFAPGYPCVYNDETLTKQAVALAQKMNIPHIDLDLRTTSDDFGYYAQRFPSLYYRLGVGPNAGKQHTSTFNPDERAIPLGIEFMTQLTLSLC